MLQLNIGAFVALCAFSLGFLPGVVSTTDFLVAFAAASAIMTTITYRQVPMTQTMWETGEDPDFVGFDESKKTYESRTVRLAEFLFMNPDAQKKLITMYVKKLDPEDVNHAKAGEKVRVKVINPDSPYKDKLGDALKMHGGKVDVKLDDFPDRHVEFELADLLQDDPDFDELHGMQGDQRDYKPLIATEP